ncbi:MAG: DUF5320 domain-containing protein [Bacteroidales bacterium]
MPGFNQTGPMGQGPMTGRKMGRCTNYGANRKEQTNDETINNVTSEEITTRGFGFGRGRFGRGRGFGMQRRFRGGC